MRHWYSSDGHLLPKQVRLALERVRNHLIANYAFGVSLDGDLQLRSVRHRAIVAFFLMLSSMVFG
jgi:hypothetical protein